MFFLIINEIASMTILTILILEDIIWKIKDDLDHRAASLLLSYTKLFSEMISTRLDAAFFHTLQLQPFPAEAAMMSHQMNRPNANLQE